MRSVIKATLLNSWITLYLNCLFLVHAIQTDNGSEFGPQFHWHILDKGIQHRYIKPHTPRLNGKIEHSHRIDGEEPYRMLQGIVIDNSKLFNEKL